MALRDRNKFKDQKLRFVTTSCYNKLFLLKDKCVTQILIRNLNKLNKRYDAKILAYVFMSNHIHLILYFVNDCYLSDYMRDFKSKTAYEIRKYFENKESVKILGKIIYCKRDQKFKIWEDRFDDQCIRKLKSFMTRFNYIHNNPVNAGLVEKPEDYKLSSANFYHTEIHDELEVTHFVEALGGTFQCKYGVL